MTQPNIKVASTAGKPVVVGVDGSADSLAAVQVALEEARRRGVGLRIVSAWSVPIIATGFGASTIAVGQAYAELYAAERASARRRLSETLEHLPTASVVPVETIAGEGFPSAVLITASREASLLVVGRRGHNRLSEMLLGSTSRSCVEHAACPVLVVPPLQGKQDDRTQVGFDSHSEPRSVAAAYSARTGEP